MVGLVVVAGWVSSPIPASAASAPVSKGSWYWREQIKSLDTPAGPVASPTGPITPPDVPRGDLAVATQGGQSDKETYLHVDTSQIPAHSTIKAFSLTLKEDPGGGNSNTSGAKIVVLAVTGFSSDGVQAGAWADRPAVATTGASPPGVRGADGTWTFDIAPIVSRWSDGSLANNGVALVSASGAPDFEVVWTTSSPAPASTGQFVPPPAAGSNQSSTSSSGADTATSPAPAPVAVAPPPQPITLTPSPSPAPVALAAPPASSSASASPNDASSSASATPAPAIPSAPAPTSSGTLSPRRASVRSHSATTGGFWIGVLAVLALAGLGMVTLGAVGDPVSARRGSVLRALETRGLSSPSSAS